MHPTGYSMIPANQTGARDVPEAFAEFAQRGAIVTGGAQGLGRAIAEALAANGAHVHVFDRNQPDPATPDIHFHGVDITDAAAIGAALQALDPQPVLLVNNAGITRDRTIAKMSDDEWQSVIAVNLTGAFNMIRAVVPGMVEAGFGRIVNITSINGLRGKFGQANYTASKAGLIGLTKTAAHELGPKGINVNAIAPGMVLTEMALALPEEFRQQAVAESALGQLAEPRDIANAVVFLLSDGARMITGQVLQVDAGQYI